MFLESPTCVSVVSFLVTPLSSRKTPMENGCSGPKSVEGARTEVRLPEDTLGTQRPKLSVTHGWWV